MKEIQAPIISINSKFNKERFEKSQCKKDNNKQQRNCPHSESVIFDGEIDEVKCETCNKIWSCFDYLWYLVERQIPNPKIKVFEIENEIYFLTKKCDKLKDDIKHLQSEKRKLNKI